MNKALLVLAAGCCGVLMVGAASSVDPLSSDIDLCGRAERDNWGAPTCFGRKGSPAVVNVPVTNAHQTVFSLNGEWEFLGDDQTILYGGKPWQLPAKGGLPTRLDTDAHWQEMMRIPLYNVHGPAKSRPVGIPGFWEPQGIGKPGLGHPWDMSDLAPFRLRHVFFGAAYLRRTFRAPAEWKGREIWLKIGGVQSLAYIWINARPAAFIRQSCGTYKFNVTGLVEPGKDFRVVALVHNNMPSKFGAANACHHFGGFYRSLELEVTDSVWLDDVWGSGDVEAKRADVHVSVRGRTAGEKVRIRLDLDGKTVTREAAAGDDVVLSVPLPDLQPWSCERPHLYLAHVTLERGGRIVHGWSERFGVRKLEIKDGAFRLNGRPFFVRGVGHHFRHPLTFVTSPDRALLDRETTLIRDLGFNSTRHHTNCPYPEYFEAADEKGIFVEPELSYDGGGLAEPHPYEPLFDTRELVRHRRRHVSFGFISFGNEGHLSDCDKDLYDLTKRIAPGVMVIHNDGGYNAPGITDFYSGPSAAWKPGTLGKRPRPFVCHEYLNVTTKLDPREEARFTGVMEPPRTIASYEAELKKAGLDRAWGDRMLDAAAALQGYYQKAGLESARRDPICSGYSFWSLSDCGASSSGPAVSQGLLTYFFELKKKGLNLEEMRACNSPSVLLLDTATPFVVVAGESFAGRIQLAHFSQDELPADAPLRWRLKSSRGILAEGSVRVAGVPARGPARTVAEVSFPVPDVSAAVEAELEVEYAGLRNAWSRWIFPKRRPRDGSRLAADATLLEKLRSLYPGIVALNDPAAGNRPLRILPWSDKAPAAAPGQRTLFVSGMNGRANVTLGWWWLGDQVGTAFLDHPALKGFPHDGTLSPLFFRVLKRGRELPFAPVPREKIVAAGEGGDRYFLYLGGDRQTLYSFGLDVLSGLPEATALLDGFIDYQLND